MTQASPTPAPTPDPTLLQLARAGSRWAQAGLVLLGALLLMALLAVTVLRPGQPKGGGATASGKGITPFTVTYARGELRTAPSAPGTVLLVDRTADEQPARLYISPLQLAAYRGAPGGALPLASPAVRAAIAARYDDASVRFVDEGLVNVGANPAYQVSYTAARDGKAWFGRAVLVVPERDGERGAVLMDGQEQRVSGAVVVGSRGVGRQDELKRPMQTLTFGG